LCPPPHPPPPPLLLTRPDPAQAAAIDQLNTFFINFFNKSFEKLSYSVKEQQYGHVLMQLTPQNLDDKCVFFNDRLRLYSQTMLWGHTGTLLTNLFLTFVLVDWHTQNWVAAAIVAYLVDRAIVLIKCKVAADNISRKALIDRAFLL
jgi:hypothetical protein